MGRKIIMTGKNARYIEHRAKGAAADEREVKMEGEFAQYEEYAGKEVAHFPLDGNRETGIRQYEFLVRNGYISAECHELCYLYIMGFTAEQPLEVGPLQWLRTKEQLHTMLKMRFAERLQQKQITDAEITKMAAACFVDKDGNGIAIPKPRSEASEYMDLLTKNFPT